MKTHFKYFSSYRNKIMILFL